MRDGKASLKLDLVIKLYQSGESYAEIERLTGADRGQVQWALKVSGIQPDRKPHLTSSQKDDIVLLLIRGQIEGWSLRYQAKRCGCSIDTLKRVAEERGIKVARKRYYDRIKGEFVEGVV